MTFERFKVVALNDLRFNATRPMIWMLLASLVLVAWGLSSGDLTISSGDSSVGGEAKAWITSEFAVAQMFPMVTFLLYSFFIAIAAGMAIPRDDEIQIGPVLHATQLSSSEYVWGKFMAVLVLFVGVLSFHLLLTMVCNQLLPNSRADLIRGPFELMSYLRPGALLALPFILFLCGISLAIGELTRRPILVFVTPIALFLVSIFFLWGWSPAWLDPRINRLLMWLEPSGFRWLNETWLKVDLGVNHYNHQAVGYDLPFLISRLVYAVLGFASVEVASRHFKATLRGSKVSAKKKWWQRLQRKAGEIASPETAEVNGQTPITSLQMAIERPSFFRTVIEVARFEARNLRAQPGLYIFVPLILLQTLGSSFVLVGAFDTPLLLTPGAAAVGSMNTLTLLVCFLLLFYTVESVSREWFTGLSPLVYSSSSQTGAILAGKAVANSIVGVVILLGCYVGAAVVMVFQGQVTPSLGPFLLVWGLLLIPTFLVWSAFVTTVLAVTGERFTTYGVGLAVMAFTGWKQTKGEMNWVGNWNLWGSTTWTDFGRLDPNVGALLLNRVFWLAVAAFLVVLTVRVFPRREHDSARVLDRLRPANVLRTALRLSPVALPVLVLGTVLGFQVSQGWGGGSVERREEEYRARNLVTWAEAKTPRLVDVDIDLELDPDHHGFEVAGTFRLENRSDQEIRRFPMSVGDHFRDLEWTLNSNPYEPDSWARLYVFTPDEPLKPGDAVTVGFSHHGKLPDGISKNGGGLGQFILPSGTVLTSFDTSFLPVPYFEAGRGVDADNRLEPRDFEEGFWEGLTRPGFGGGSRYNVRTKISGPERFAYHGVGVRVSEEVENGRRTVVWQSDHPVNFFNVVAGEWSEWQGDGVSVYYHPDHAFNVEEIGQALEASRRYYSEWFYPYPWKELKLSEFPGLASYAQGFPTNITFSENIGFLTRSTSEAQAAFVVTAHEAAHQWWGNILLPGEGPGGNVLSEGMAHFSTVLLHEEVKGLAQRIEVCKRMETSYAENRRADGERSLVWTDGSKTGDTTVTYDKGGWVTWMLLNHMGRERTMAGLQDFIGHYVASDDYPVLQDFVSVMREHAADPAAFDDFTEQWYFDVVVPQYRVEDARIEETSEGWVVHATVSNNGTGRMPVEIAAVSGVRFPDGDDSEAKTWHEARSTVILGEGESTTITIPCDFEAEKLVVDPDVLVLQLHRDRATVELGT